MAWHLSSLIAIFNRVFSIVREYFSGEVLGVEAEHQEPVPNVDDNSDNNIDEDNGNGECETESDGRPVVNITIPSNAGTVIIGDKSVLNYHPGIVGVLASENEQTPSASSNSNEVKLDPPEIVELGEENKKIKPRRKRRPRDVVRTKVPSIVKRISELEKTLPKYIANGEWDAHNDAIEQLMNEFKRDEDNSDIILFLKYEKAAAYYARNKIEMARKLVTEVSKEIDDSNGKNIEHVNDIQKMIYCKCLFLVSKIYCFERTFEKSRKALNLAKKLVSENLNSVELEAKLLLGYAFHQCRINEASQAVEVRCKSSGAKDVIDHTNKAQEISSKFKNSDQEKWKEINRDALLIRCKAITHFFLETGGKDEFADVFNRSLAELEESQIWDGISLRQKAEFYVLKCDVFTAHGNVAKALDDANDGLQIAQVCGFDEVLVRLNDRIRKLRKFPDVPMNDSNCLVKKVRDMQTTTDGNVESNAAAPTDCGIFSTDESDWDTRFLHEEGAMVPFVEEA